MSRFKRSFFIFGLITIMLISPGVLRNYNLKYLNWTWLPSPISSQTIRCFSNTNDCTQELAAVQNAAATWNGSGAAFSFPQSQEGLPPPKGGFSGIIRDSTNQIGWLWPWPREYELWAAVTMTWCNVDDPGRIIEADTAFNDEKIWSTESTPPPGAYDVQSVMLHEFGHWLNLGHSAAIMQGQTPIVMQPSIPPAGGGESGLRRNLAPDDIDGAKAIYNYIGWAEARITYNAGWSVEPAIAVTHDDFSS